MITPPTEAEVLQHNQVSLAELRTVLRREAGDFSLTLAACNYHYLRQVIIDAFQADHQGEGAVAVVRLPGRVTGLLAAIQEQLGASTPAAVMVTGLEAQDDLPALLTGANLARDELRKALPCPLVLWVNETVRQQFVRLAPDLRSFSPSPIPFTLPDRALIHALEAGTTQLFVNMLEYEGDRDLSGTTTIRLKSSPLLRSELEFALQDLSDRGWQPDPDLAASLDFLRAREAHSRLEMEAARQHYEASLAHWQDPAVQRQQRQGVPSALDREAVLLLHLGLWWRSQAVLQRATYQGSLRQARRYFQECLKIFREEDQTERLARFIHVLAEVLQKQRDWDSLETLAVEGITLHQQTDDPIRLGRDHGFLAEVALIREDWLTAQQEAALALTLLEEAAREAELEPRRLLSQAVQVADRFQRGWYRFLLGKAQMHLKDPKLAITYLEAARWETDPEVDLTLHRQVLEELIHHHFAQGQYWEAFDIKQELRQVEYRYNLRAFIGAGAVQPHSPMALAQGLSPRHQAAVAAEIRASGRLPDVQALLKRLEDSQHQIIVIHGPSGVGKSSILTAGLMPALSTRYPEGHTTLPMLVQTYGTWPQTLAKEITKALAPWEDLPEEAPAQPVDLHQLQETLRLGVTRNTCFFVFLFDQFEEFFFEEKSPEERRSLYEFLQFCIDQPWVKVVLTLREDYLHHLLEVEQVVNQINPMTGLDVLSREVRYPLGNFSPQAAEAVIRQLTEAAQYPLEEALIHRLVADLAAPLGSVRPIELQVVGAQLQRETIDTLAQYEALGDSPKETLVQRFLAYVVHDCGPPNERLAWVVLYLLTDEDRDQRLYRPLRTREELEYELALLEMPFDLAQLDLVMSILVGSGLVFEVPEEPEDRYQLVHDYLVSYVRQVQTPGLMAELQAARAEAEAAAAAKKLAETERDQLAEANAVLASAKEEAEILVQLAEKEAAKIRQGVQLEREGLRALRQLDKNELSAMLIAAKATRALRALPDAQVLTDYPAYSPLLALQMALDTCQWTDVLAHQGPVNSASFSPDGEQVVTASHDCTARLWNIKTGATKVLEGHQGVVTSASFSPDGEQVVTASNDGTAGLWNLKTGAGKALKGHQNTVNSASFSPNGQQVVTASNDSTARLWEIKTGGSKILAGHRHQSSVFSASFSSDGQQVVTASSDGTARLWDVKTGTSKILAGHHHQSRIFDASFSPDGQQVVTASSDGTVRLWDVKTVASKNLADRKYQIDSVSFSPDGQQVVTASSDGTVRIWDIQTGAVTVLEGRQLDIVNSVSFSPDGQRVLIASSYSNVRLWNVKTGASKILKGHKYAVWSASFSPDSQQVVTASADGTARLWGSKSGASTLLEGHQDRVVSASFSPDGQRVVTASADGTARIWDVKSGASTLLEGHQDRVISASFSPDGQQAVTASADGTARIWDVKSGASTVLEGHQDRVVSASFSPDSQQVVTASDDDTARIWDVKSGASTVLEGHQDRVVSASFSPDGQQVVTASENGTARLWDVKTGTSIVLEGHQAWVSSANFSSDGQQVVTASYDGTARLWDVETGASTVLTGYQDGYQDRVRNASFSPDGQQVVTASENGTARLWDVKTGTSIVLEGHQSSVRNASFDPDGQRVITFSNDGTVRVWLLNGQQIAEYPGRGLAVNPQWTRVATVQDGDAFTPENAISIWRIDDIDNLLIRACQRLRFYLPYAPGLSDSDRALCDGIPTQLPDE